MRELASEPTVIALADTLVSRGDPGANPLHALLQQYPQAGDISQVEAGLFRHHFTWAQVETESDEDNHRLMRRHLERQIDLVNVIGALRAVRDAQGDGFTPVGRGFLRSDSGGDALCIGYWPSAIMIFVPDSH